MASKPRFSGSFQHLLQPKRTASKPRFPPPNQLSSLPFFAGKPARKEDLVAAISAAISARNHSFKDGIKDGLHLLARFSPSFMWDMALDSRWQGSSKQRRSGFDFLHQRSGFPHAFTARSSRFIALIPSPMDQGLLSSLGFRHHSSPKEQVQGLEFRSCSCTKARVFAAKPASNETK
ncbi:hypothetical protein BJ508DRAFT_336914 [Ascobolus immersus RN42]|uniref:Uncharacterized protein n=1 Tax=Ascobolus immersus RN42 TaxID=1160509 RepID=A0A3N4H6W2_ASCIM|nr:hypothetical protein BJ508DRAFT_336915 [Ascobolus immersus RN42]RPA70684.1 hypothetical protein BJ508DRAFT_336914 [Ascobolus immersus RN42]